jgi:hypothetical protein
LWAWHTHAHRGSTDGDTGFVDRFTRTNICLSYSGCRFDRIDCDVDQSANAHVNRYAARDADVDRYASRNAHANGYADGYAHANRCADGYAHADANGNSDCYADADCHINTYANGIAGRFYRRPARTGPECAVAPERGAMWRS